MHDSFPSGSTAGSHPKVKEWLIDPAVEAAIVLRRNVMVAARGAGLDTCPQAAFAFMRPVLRDALSIPAAEIVVCGMALGFADPDAVVNRLETVRADVDSLASFHD